MTLKISYKQKVGIYFSNRYEVVLIPKKHCPVTTLKNISADYRSIHQYDKMK